MNRENRAGVGRKTATGGLFAEGALAAQGLCIMVWDLGSRA
jgi:hypothetical protein